MNKIIVSSVIAFSFLAVVAFVPVIGMVGNSSNSSFGVAFADLTDYSVSEGDWNWGFEGSAPAPEYSVSEGDWNWGFDSGCYDYCGGDTSCYDCGGSTCDWDCYGGESYGCEGCGGSYSTGGGSFGGGSFGGYSMPRTYSTGGGYIVTPRTYSPPQSSGGSQNQNQTQTQSTNVSNTNTNTNTNINNNTAIAVVQVQAPSAPSYPSYPNYPQYPTYQAAPYCSIYQAQSYGGYGYNRPVYLSWSSSNAQSAYLSNYGSVAVNGSQTVYPTYATTYTLTVYGYNGQQATCQTTVNVGSYVPPTPIPTTPYVSLTQIPYTGVDFGTFGNAMYFAAIAILALGGAYLVVFYVPQLAFARGINKRSFAPVVAPKAPLLLEKEAKEAKVTPIVASIRKGTNDTMAIVQAKGSLPKIVIDRS